MTFLILTYIFAMAAKKRNFYGEKRAKISGLLNTPFWPALYDLHLPDAQCVNILLAFFIFLAASC